MLDYLQSESLWECLPDTEAITLLARVASAAPPPTQDTFTPYSLFHAKRKPLIRRQDSLAGAILSTSSIVFDIYSDDLANANLPLPQEPWITFVIFDQTAGTFTGDLTNGNNVITGLMTTAGILQGMGVVGTGVTPGSTVQAVGSGQITLSAPATSTISGATVTVGVSWIVTSLKEHITKAKWIAECERGR